MYVTVQLSGTIVFRFDYRLNDRRETLTLGRYGPAGRFKAVNSKAKNYTRGKLRQKLGEIDKAVNPAKSACLTEITEVR